MQQAKVSVQEIYEQRRRRFARQFEDLSRRGLIVGRVRLACAIVAVAGAYLYLSRQSVLIGAIAVCAACFFFASVVWHQRLRKAARHAELLREINQTAIARIERRWRDLPIPPVNADHQASGLSRDLNLFGQASLMQLLSDVMSPSGSRILAESLAHPRDNAAIVDRQAAVRALAPQLDARQELCRIARRYPAAERQVDALQRWLDVGACGPAQPWLKAWVRFAAVATPAAIALHVVGITTPLIWPLFVVANLLLTAALAKRVHRIFNEVTHSAPGLAQCVHLIAGISALSACPLVERLRQRLAAGDASAARLIQRLYLVCELTELRRSTLIYVFVQALTLWDFHLLWKLGAWRQSHGKQVAGWLDAIGEIEALCALSGLHHDNPAWAFPVVASGAERKIVGTQLGHPLLADGVRVDNDVTVGPQGTFLLITGSNMSGKSTLLRTLGLNIALAQTGAPVCAKAMQMPPCVLGTSIKIQDSFEDGVSLFLAELKRIREVVQLCEAGGADGRYSVVFLLDEVLRGTNSAERRTAVRRIVRSLLNRGAIGALTTHDLDLAAAPDLQGTSVPVHFRERVENNGGAVRMSFDYKLRPGLATTSNALVLLQIMGLAE